MSPSETAPPSAARSATLRISVPGNLLLAGEYSVLEEGGLGIGVAVDVRAVATRAPGPSRITGIMPGKTIQVPGDDGVLGGAAEFLWGTTLPDRLGSITIDTSPFHYADGRKKGFGSSAAATVALTAMWLAFTGATRTQPSPDEVFELAVRAHRAGQHGYGSGYDVASSTFGGFTLFSGGERPHAEPVTLPWLEGLSLFPGVKAVRTTDAVGRYRE
ncbi:MAG: hypothetical protein E4H09_03125, partial [Spirochaetales bacterium]